MCSRQWNAHRLVKLLYFLIFTNISKFSGNNIVFCNKNFSGVREVQIFYSCSVIQSGSFFFYRVLGTSLTSKRKCRLKIAKMKKVILFAMLAIFQNVTHFPVLAILQICSLSLLSFSKFSKIAVDCKKPVGYSNLGNQ